MKLTPEDEMEAKHTPGPWSIYKVDVNLKGIGFSDKLMGPNEEVIASLGAPHPNHNLLKAAPDLLEALKNAMRMCGRCDGSGSIIPGAVPELPCPICVDSKAAIAKAEGREQA
ncbi:hypothetical protein LCGC14_1059480 [marine sediment metagenome]|uniref:Uncharacterized protein n=1 Tax=marine sediment metagenome TaxID=412755 RepID=A0A0F9Q4F1_9ZZZZ